MTNPLEPTPAPAAPAGTPAAAPRAASRAPSTGGASFAEQHSAAMAEQSSRSRAPKPPRGERWEPVAGRSDYADIVSGPRNGFFVNLREGPRQGEAFHVVRRDGRTFHVYGTGDDREVIEVRSRRPDPDRLKPKPGEEWEMVGRHRDYRQIEGGRRDGLYVNTSGNERTGRTFEIERRGERTFHVYGSGRDKVEIEVGWRSRSRDDDGDGGARAERS